MPHNELIQSLREYFRMRITFIRRYKTGGWQRRWVVTVPETDCRVATCKTLKQAVRIAHIMHVRAINDSITHGQLILF